MKKRDSSSDRGLSTAEEKRSESSAARRKSRANDTCRGCKQQGHWVYDCPVKKAAGQETVSRPVKVKVVKRAEDDVDSGTEEPANDRRVRVVKAVLPELQKLGGAVYLRVRVNGRVIYALLDTGCEHSLVGTRCLPLDVTLQPSRIRLTAANGSSIPLRGQVKVNLQTDQFTSETELLVSDNVTEMILGIDWLVQEDCEWSFRKKCLIAQGHHCRLFVRNGRSRRVRRVIAQEDVVIPARELAAVPTTIVWSSVGEDSLDTFIVEPKELATGIMITRTMIDQAAFQSALPVVNLTSKAYAVRKGDLIAVAAPAEAYCEISPPVQPASGQHISDATIDHLQGVIDGFSPNFTAAEKAAAEAFVREYRDLFSTSEFDIGRTNLIQHTIDTGDSRPFKQQLRRHPWAHQEVIDAHVEKMLDTGVISPTVSPWSSNVVLVKKSSGELRFCVDFRQLNNLTVKDSYPLPRIDSCMDSLGGAKYFSTLDLRSGYWQVELDKESSEKTAFVTRKGIYKFNVLAFGLSNAPAIFQRLMDLVLLGLNWQICLAFLDDVIVMSSTFEQHLERLRQVFERFRGANLKLNAGKCHLMQERVKFLGSIVSKDGIAPDPEKVRAVTEWPVPTDLKQVRGFVALASYYRKHIEHFADIARPLHRLSCKEAPFIWGPEQQAAFERLKEVLSSAPLVRAPLPEGQFTLDTDASDEGLGAALHQEQDGVTVVIAYASRGLKKEEKNYCTTRKELLAIVYGLKQFRSFLLGPMFLLRTDHAALTSLLKTPEPVGQQARWLDLLAEYHFKIQHRAGAQHNNADSLSRRPCDRLERQESCKQCPRGQPILYCPVDEVDVEDGRPQFASTTASTTVGKVVQRSGWKLSFRWKRLPRWKFVFCGRGWCL